MKYVRIFLIIFGITFLITCGVYFFTPNYIAYLRNEDSLVENISAGSYLISCCIGLIFLLKNKKNQRAIQFVSAISLLGFLDELSFGERLLGLKMPQILGIKIDAVHDFFYLGYIVIRKVASTYPNFAILFLWSSIVIIAFILLKFRSRLAKKAKKIYNQEPFILFLFFLTLIFLSLVIDLEIVKSVFLFLLEEIFEMNAALALLMCCLSLQAYRSSNQLIS